MKDWGKKIRSRRTRRVRDILAGGRTIENTATKIIKSNPGGGKSCLLGGNKDVIWKGEIKGLQDDKLQISHNPKKGVRIGEGKAKTAD